MTLKLHKDKWGRHEVYLAEYNTGVYSNTCIFSRLDPAIFFVVTGLVSDIDWNNFPDPTKKYPYEDRDASNLNLTPVFIVEQTNKNGKKVSGRVTKFPVADQESAGNGIAVRGRDLFLSITGRDEAKLTGEGDRLSGTVKGKPKGI